MDWFFERPIVLLVLLMIFGLGSVVMDNTDWFDPKTGTDYIGMPRTFDGKSYYCSKVTRQGYCSEWEDVADSATDVAEAFGPNMLGVAKGEAPLLPTDLWYASFLNPINATVFSISMQSGLPVYAVLLIGASIIWLLALRALKPKSVGIVLAVTVLPGYVTFMSVATLSGGMFLVSFVHICGLPLSILLIFLKLLAGINIVTGSRQNSEGASESFTIIGDMATKTTSLPTVVTTPKKTKGGLRR